MSLPTNIQILLMESLISLLPHPEREEIRQCATAIRNVLEGEGNSGKIALSLVVAEQLTKEELR